MIKKVIKGILFAAGLLTCIAQHTMGKETIPTLELITKKAIPGHLCSKYQKGNNFLVLKKEKQKHVLEIWNKKLTQKIDVLTSSQLLEALLTFHKEHIPGECYIGWKSYFEEEIGNFMQTAEIIEPFAIAIKTPITDFRGTLVITYYIRTKTIEVSYKKSAFTYDYNRVLFTHKNYMVEHFFETKTLQIKHYNTSVTTPIKLDSNWLRSIDKLFGGTNHILISRNNFETYKINNAILHDIQTGKPVIKNGIEINLKNYIPNWNIKNLQYALFGKNDDYIVLLCYKEFRLNQIILFDLKQYRPIGQYTFESDEIQTDIAIHLGNQEKIIAISQNYVYIFKNPLAKKDTDEEERVVFSRETNEIDEKFTIILFNNITIGVDKLFLMN